MRANGKQKLKPKNLEITLSFYLNIKLPIHIQNKKNYDYIQISKVSKFKPEL